MYHRRSHFTIWIYTTILSLAVLLLSSGNAAANMNSEPLLDKDGTFLGILLTFLLNFPLNFIMITGMLSLATRYSKKIDLTIPPERYFMRLLGATFLLTWFGAFVDYTVFVLVDSLAGYVIGLFAIGLSFYIAVRFALKHGVPVSEGVTVVVVIMNAVAWLLLMRIRVFEFYMCCFPLSMTVFFLSLFLFFFYKVRYRERYFRVSTEEQGKPKTKKDDA